MEIRGQHWNSAYHFEIHEPEQGLYLLNIYLTDLTWHSIVFHCFIWRIGGELVALGELLERRGGTCLRKWNSQNPLRLKSSCPNRVMKSNEIHSSARLLIKGLFVQCAYVWFLTALETAWVGIAARKSTRFRLAREWWGSTPSIGRWIEAAVRLCPISIHIIRIQIACKIVLHSGGGIVSNVHQSIGRFGQRPLGPALA